MVISVPPCEAFFYNYDPCFVALVVRLAPDPHEWAERWELLKIEQARVAKERAEKAERIAKRIAWENSPAGRNAKRLREKRRHKRLRAIAQREREHERERLRFTFAPHNPAIELIKAIKEHPEQFAPDYRWPYGDASKPRDWPN